MGDSRQSEDMAAQLNALEAERAQAAAEAERLRSELAAAGPVSTSTPSVVLCISLHSFLWPRHSHA